MGSRGIKYKNPVDSFGTSNVSRIAAFDPRISGTAYKLLSIYDYHTREAESCWPGRERLAKLLQCSPATVTRANAELEEAGYISRSRRMGSSSLTYLEQINASPDLQEFARHILSGEAAEDYDWQNKRSSAQICADVGSNMSRSTAQKCAVETSLKETSLKKNLSTSKTSTSFANESEHKLQILSIPEEFLGMSQKDYMERCQYCTEKIPQKTIVCPGCGSSVRWDNSAEYNKFVKNKDKALKVQERLKKEADRKFGEPADTILALARSTWPVSSEIKFGKRGKGALEEANRINNAAQVYGEDVMIDLVKDFVQEGNKGRGLIAHLLNRIEQGSVDIKGSKEDKSTTVFPEATVINYEE